jgi:prevent-host-death family protein
MVYSIADARQRFSDLVKRAAYRGETVTIGTRGKPEAALISVDELRRLQQAEAERDAQLLEDSVRRSAGTVGVRELLRAWAGTPKQVRRTPAKRRTGARDVDTSRRKRS